MTLKPGLETLHHQSDNCTEILVCISGKGKVTIGSKDIDIRTGHSIHLPVKTPFKLKNEADSPVEFVGFCINAGSLENLAFKTLRNDQTIARLNELIIKSYDLMFSKEELKEKKHLADWEEAMLAALSTKNDKDSQPHKYGEKRPPIGI